MTRACLQVDGPLVQHPMPAMALHESRFAAMQYGDVLPGKFPILTQLMDQAIDHSRHNSRVHHAGKQKSGGAVLAGHGEVRGALARQARAALPVARNRLHCSARGVPGAARCAILA